MVASITAGGSNRQLLQEAQSQILVELPEEALCLTGSIQTRKPSQLHWVYPCHIAQRHWLARMLTAAGFLLARIGGQVIRFSERQL
jgi:hypothetical protein